MTKQAVRPLIVGLGEAMVRLSTPGRVPLQVATQLELDVAGSELNLLVAASALGARGRWLTRLPANALGELIRRHALSFGLEVESNDEIGGRVGLYFLELGAPPRPSTVLYDRKDSASSHLRADEFDWRHVLDGAAAAHVTGITCALGAGPMAATLEFLGAARDLGVMTSFDVNYRSQLWGVRQARKSYLRALPLVDTLFASPGDLAMLCGQDGDTEAQAKEVIKEFGISTLVLRERQEISASEIAVNVQVVGDDESDVTASGYVVDEIGAGDAAAGAFLASMLRGDSSAVSAERCARAYARMLTIPGDTWSGTLHDLTDGYVSNRRVER
jgi:2-dehydro-3-deoxygluconokinase